MKTTELKKTEVWAIVFSLIFMLGLTTAEAQQKFKIAGTGDYTMIEGQAFNISDAEGHIVRLNKAEGNNLSTGETEWMQNARAVNISFTDVTKGNGFHQGYVIIEKDNDKIVSRWEGKMTTKLSDAGQPVTTFKGNMWWTEATGKYENMHGVATYKGWFTSENTYRVEWEGEYFNKKEAVSKR
ncbi:MAG: hypothetical protein ACQEQB_13465 [Bacteroidota bacterium]